MKKILLSLLIVLYTGLTVAQEPTIEWDYSTINDIMLGRDYLNSSIVDSKGNYISVGSREIIEEGNNVRRGFIIKLDNVQKNVLWEKFILSNTAEIKGITEVSDGYFILTGDEYSCQNGQCGSYGSIIKINSEGEQLGEKTSNICFEPLSMLPSNEGGFIVMSSGKDKVWLSKINNNGQSLWKNIWNGVEGISPTGMKKSQDGQYIIWARIGSADNKISTIFKVNEAGDITWEKSFDFDITTVLPVQGGYILTSREEKKVDNYRQYNDVKITKIDNIGTEIFSIMYDYKYDFYSGDYPPISANLITYDIIGTEDGGYILLNTMDASYANSVMSNSIFVVKLDRQGQKIWETVLPGEKYSYPKVITSLGNKRYMVASDTNYSFWTMGKIAILKDNNTLNSLSTQETQLQDKDKISVYPNPAKDYVNIKLPESGSIKSGSLTDFSGKILNIKAEGNRLNLSSLPSGIYILKIQTASNKIYTKKISKQ